MMKLFRMMQVDKGVSFQVVMETFEGGGPSTLMRAICQPGIQHARALRGLIDPIPSLSSCKRLALWYSMVDP